MTDLRTELDGALFTLRAVILCEREGKVLVEGGNYPFRNFPGGAAQLGETLRDAAAREWREETGLDVGELQLTALVENFFELTGRRWHELGFYFRLTTPVDFSERRQNADNPANHLDWADLQGGGLPIYPTPALTLLDVPAGQFRHIIHRDWAPAPSSDLRFGLEGTEVQVRVHLLYVQDGQLLTNTVPGSGFLFLPGGSVRLNEDSQAAALREFREETGVEAVSAQLVGLTEGFDPASHRQQLGLCYRVEAAQPLPLTVRPVQDQTELVLDWVPLPEVEAHAVQPAGLSRFLDTPAGHLEQLVLNWS
ncbi:NUDIX domain-containing protein [Deinococcus sp. Marseille-Q6407]|uniref:NUDIX domain-containing protein n=1 Tax=Deinococcus sp. Marseille-Q6407 TaxID=2969223 RepID=UPI0021BE1182|nr:NUDIX domain-containing protein [Deinococcus sp. Marseille-Q6407]